MAAISLTVDRIDYPPGGAIEVVFSNSTSLSFASLAALTEFATFDDPVSVIQKSSMAHWLQRSPTAADDSLIEGKTFSFDPAQNDSVIGVS